MVDMSKFSGKKEFPSQTENRRQWILDTVRANQLDVWRILHGVTSKTYPDDMNLNRARDVLRDMHKSDRDAILQPNGILTDSQIDMLK